MNIGFIGLGQMGAGMAACLLKVGHSVTVFNRTAGRADALKEKGANVVTTSGEACRGEAVVTMLANDEAIEEIVFGKDGMLALLPPKALHVSSSTISVSMSQRLTAAHARSNQRFVAAPVFGRPEAAAAGQLFVIAGGEKSAIDAATPIFDAIGQKTFTIAPTPWTANLVKLSGNFLIASVIESLGEAIALVAKGGVEPRQYVEILTSTIFNAPVYKTYGGLIAGGKFTPAGFAASLGQKDIRLTLEAADGLGVPLPIANVLRDRFLSLLAHGGQELDWSAIGQLAAKDAALTFSEAASTPSIRT